MKSLFSLGLRLFEKRTYAHSPGLLSAGCRHYLFSDRRNNSRNHHHKKSNRANQQQCLKKVTTPDQTRPDQTKAKHIHFTRTMNNKSPPTQLDLVLIGGGHAHVHVLKMLGMPPNRQWLIEHGVQVTLIARDLHTPYSGQLPGFVAGHYTYDEIHLDVAKLCRFSNTRLVHATAHKITYSRANSTTSTTNNRIAGSGMVYCSDGRPPIRFDALSIDVGITPSTSGITTKTSAENMDSAVVPVKPIANFCRAYQDLQQTILNKYSNSNSNTNQTQNNNKHVVAVIGGGAGGIELAMSMRHAFRDYPHQVQVMVVTRGKSLLAQHNASVQRIFKRILKERNIDVYHQAEVIGVEQHLDTSLSCKRLVLSKTTRQNYRDPIVVDSIIWCTQASAASWLSEDTPLATTKKGNFVQIESTYESVSHKGIFACGDCCHMVDHPRPKAGVFAVRAGPPLLENLKRYLSNQPLQRHVPQRDFLGLISTGDKYAVASKGWWFALEGRYLWTLKDYIDRTWMEKYTVLPNLEEMMSEMSFSSGSSCWSIGSGPPQRKRRKLGHPTATVGSLNKGKEVADNFFAADPMRCGGCGAKVGATTLSRVLSTIHIRQVKRARQLQQPPPPPMDHDDAAILPLPKQRFVGGTGAIVQSIDYFRSLLDDPFVFGKIVAVHALSDVHAMGGHCKAQSAMALAVVPFAADDAITESLLVHLLSGISDVIQAEGVQLVGGHTCEGTELACGLSVQGYTESAEKLLRKRGGKVGDRIILTKPLGTGALFAADMRAQCRGEFMAQAIESMVQSNYEASKIAKATTGVHACTDCTGFGLMGHLLEMLMANEGNNGGKDAGTESIGAVLDIRAMEFLKGGLEASENDIFSTLQPQNQRNRRAVVNHTAAAKTYPVEYPLLFDPQTAGGLIFFVDPKTCDTFTSQLKDIYASTAVIGELVPYPEDESVLSGGVCPIGSGGVSTGQRVRIAL